VTWDFPNRYPSNLVETLRRIRLDVDAISEMDYLTKMENLSPHDAATRWMVEIPKLFRSAQFDESIHPTSKVFSFTDSPRGL
jgi:glycine betaine/proline transport system substrate-binding protein